MQAQTANDRIRQLRAEEEKASAARRQQEVMQAAARWGAANPDVMEWLDANAGSNSFAASLVSYLCRKGHLSDGQRDAVRRILSEQAAAPAPAAEPVLVVPGNAVAAAADPAAAIDVSRIEAAFERARASGLIRLRMNLDTFTFKPAKANGRNAGGIYVTEGGTYLGVVLGGAFRRTPACTPEQVKRIAEVAADPAAAAVAYGQETGQCAICGLTLTDPESVSRGIGPICAGRFGFGA